jgi:hypothetical protein
MLGTLGSGSTSNGFEILTKKITEDGELIY